MIKRHHTYRCPSMLDLDIHVLSIPYVGPNYAKVKVCFVYRRNPNETIMDSKTYKISYENLKKWVDIRELK